MGLRQCHFKTFKELTCPCFIFWPKLNFHPLFLHPWSKWKKDNGISFIISLVFTIWVSIFLLWKKKICVTKLGEMWTLLVWKRHSSTQVWNGSDESPWPHFIWEICSCLYFYFFGFCCFIFWWFSVFGIFCFHICHFTSCFIYFPFLHF